MIEEKYEKKFFSRYSTWAVGLLCVLATSFGLYAGLPPTSLGGGLTNAVNGTTFKFIAPWNQATQVAGTTWRIETGSSNWLSDANFESLVTAHGWVILSASGTVTTDSTNPISEKRSGLFTIPSSGGLQAKSPPISGLNAAFAGTQGQYSCRFNNNGSTPIAVTIAITDTTGTVVTSKSGSLPANGIASQQIIGDFFTVPQFTPFFITISSSTASQTFDVDSCFVGPIPFNALSSIGPTTSWLNAGANVIGSTTASPPTKGTTTGTGGSDKFFWRQVGTNMEFRMEYAQSATTGSAIGGGNYLYTFPTSTGCQMDSNKVTFNTGSSAVLSSNIIGSGYVTSSTSGQPGSPIAYDATHFRIVAGANGSGATNWVGAANTWYDVTQASISYTVSGSVPCLGWSAQTAVSPTQGPQAWSGYHDSTCSWARTNAAYGDPTADATCVLTQRTNLSFGSVSSVAGLLPGITFTPSLSGTYYVCAVSKAAPNITALAATLGIQLTDGSGTQLSESVETGLVTSGYQEFTNCAFITTTAGTAYTTKLQSKASAGQITIGGNGGSAIEWTIFPTVFQFPTPLLIGNIISGAQDTERIERAVVAADCTASPCTITSQSGAWVSSITRAGTGNYSLNFPAGIWSAAPTCVINSANATGTTFAGVGLTATTSIYTFFTNSNQTTSADSRFNVICMGSK